LAKSFFLAIFVRRKDISANENIKSAVVVAYKLRVGRVMLLSSVLPYQGPECFGAFLFTGRSPVSISIRFYEED
jgi:hypothetical protein